MTNSHVMPTVKYLKVSLIGRYKSLVKMKKGKEDNACNVNEEVKKLHFE